MRGLTGKRAIVTGGGSGIGRATVLRLVEEGCEVGIFDIDRGRRDGDRCRAARGHAQAYRTDIADRASVEQSAAAFERDIGPADLLANVAGWERPMNFLDTDTAFWDKIIAINLYGPLHMHHVVVRGMAERGFGRVVNVASDAGRVGSSGEAVYSACKGGIIAFTKTLGPRTRAAQRHAERVVSWADRYAAVRCDSRRSRLAARKSARRWPARCRCGGSARPRIIPGSLRFCCRMTPAISPGRRSRCPAD